MKKFKFRLERIRQLKEAEKAEAMRALKVVLAKRAETESRLNELIQAWGEGDVPTTSKVEDFVLDAQYRARLKAQVAKTRSDLEQIEASVEQHQASYREAHRSAQVFDNLKTKAKEQYEEMIKQEEAKFLDELSIQRHYD